MSLKENLLDVCQLQWCASDPFVQKHLRKILLPKRSKEPLPQKVIDLLATPHILNEPEDFDESDEETEPEVEISAGVQQMESDEESVAESDVQSEVEEMDQD